MSDVDTKQDDTPNTDNNDQKPSENKDSEKNNKSTLPPLIGLFKLSKDAAEADIKRIVYEEIGFQLNKFPFSSEYNILFLFDKSTMIRADTDRIYIAVTGFTEKKPILLILNSNGGDVSAAYQISKLCREYTKDRFVVAVPRRAKSAAAMICCGADEIHMGSLSELGPIDPQINGIPTLALKNAVEHLAELVRKYPASSDMFAAYLSKSLNLQDLGYYERVAVSSAHYATNLLTSRPHTDNSRASEIANRLVYKYSDHGFVIDSNECAEIFGQDTIKKNSNEYKLANALYLSLDFMETIIAQVFKRHFYFTGSASEGCVINKMQ